MRDSHGRFVARKKPTKRNVDFFTRGRTVHPVRDSYGYREWLTNSEKGKELRANLRKRKRR